MADDLPLRVRLDPELDLLLNHACEMRHMSRSAFVRESLREALAAGGTIVDRVGLETMKDLTRVAAQILQQAMAEACDNAKERFNEELRIRFGNI